MTAVLDRAPVRIPLIFGSLLVLTATGLVSLTSYNLLPSRSVLDAAFFLSALVLAGSVARSVLPLLLGVVGFVAVHLAVMWFVRPETDLRDFLQAYKGFLVVAGLALFVGHRLARPDLLVMLTKVVLWAALAKYALARFASPDARLSSRPGLWAENNYEVTLLCILLVLTYPMLGRRRLGYFVLLLGIVALSGSRSGAAAIVPVYLYLFFVLSGRTLLLRYLNLVGAGVMGMFALVVFQSRLTENGLDSVDRLRFLDVFRSETSSWDGLNYLFGSVPLTPLSDNGCGWLSYYQSLFSYTDAGTCYSVVLHSYVLRVVFDTGLVGLLVALGGCWLVLKRAGVTRALRLTLIALVLLNAVSISALNDAFVGIGLALAILSAPEPAPPPAPPPRGTTRARRSIHAG